MKKLKPRDQVYRRSTLASLALSANNSVSSLRFASGIARSLSETKPLNIGTMEALLLNRSRVRATLPAEMG